MKAFFARKDYKTFKPLKKSHGTHGTQRLRDYTAATLGSGDIRSAVLVPQGEERCEWIAANTMDFFDHVSLMYGLVADQAAAKYTKPSEGFPSGFEYRWADGVKIKTPVKCSSPEYVDYVMEWASDKINDPALFPRSDGSPNYMYNERCCPWTQAGFSTPGGWCHDLPEGATCTQENQCASFPAQRSNGAINEAGTNDLHINGLHCSETPILHNTGRHAGNVYAQYNRTWAATREPGNDNFDDRLVDRVAIVAQYEDTEPGDWDPSNLLRKCTKSLMPGEPCCDANGNNCQDFRCGAPGAHWGLGWFGLSDPRNGKCSWWDGGRDPFRFPNADGSPNYRYKQRCCPWTERGSQTGGAWCHDDDGGVCDRFITHAGLSRRDQRPVWPGLQQGRADRILSALRA